MSFSNKCVSVCITKVFFSVPSISNIPATPSVDRTVKPALGPASTTSFVRSGLRIVVVPKKVMMHFLTLANKNTLNNIETCGILAGKLVNKY